ncbi:glycosyltransferase family 4 protein [Winogradskyella sp.]|uniref:glycosyltransferase family 4 protein n=1 Tax=Winogradskyella sp. TaxID=1883156 RepID=UPI0026064310|nr:glycosyltransferase family 4 protein [Winogradskyella sp.]
MKNVLYVGNALSSKGRTTTSIENLGTRLTEFCSIKIASDKSNKILRLLDMMLLVIVNRKHTDFILIDTYSTTNFYYALVVSQLSRLFKIKYIPILHGGNLERRLKRNPKMSRLIFKYAYVLVSPSNFLRNTFKNYGFNNVEYIPNSIEIENFEFQNRDIETIKLLWVRSFAEIYNPEMAVLVQEGVLEEGYKAELTMVGPESDGSLEKTKLMVKNKGLDVNFTGKLSRQEWVNLSKACNIFINTTNYDNAPVSVIEAMALGLPIVSTNVGGLPFLISNDVDGLLVKANDVEAMVKAIVKLKKNKTLKDKLVANAREKVEQFNWKIVKQKWETLLT